jgi:drug/metabolite transporter (DMT)-like permease
LSATESLPRLKVVCHCHSHRKRKLQASQPLFSAALGYAYFRQRLPPRQLASLVLVALGVGIVCHAEAHFHWFAFAAALASTLSLTLGAAASKGFMQRHDGMSKATVTLLTRSYSLLLLLPLWLASDARAFVGGAAALPSRQAVQRMCANALLMTVQNYGMV